MSEFDRRSFLKLLGAGAATVALAPHLVFETVEPIVTFARDDISDVIMASLYFQDNILARAPVHATRLPLFTEM